MIPFKPLAVERGGIRAVNVRFIFDAAAPMFRHIV
jgi:hypothetical protein